MNHSRNASTLWMLIPCLLVVLLLVTVGKNLPPAYFWPILIGVCVLSHVFLMRRHGSAHLGAQDDGKMKDGGEHKQKGGGCCG